MTTDDFTAAAWEHWDSLPDMTSYTPSMAYAEGVGWARDYLAARSPQVTIVQEDGQPATCEVRQGGVLIFAGRDHSADLRVAAQEPTDAEIEAAAVVIWESYDLLDRAAIRDALSAARRDEEKR